VLVNGPIIGEGVFAKNLGMNGIELVSDAVEQLGPFRFELTIHQELSFGPVGNVREAVRVPTAPKRQFTCYANKRSQLHVESVEPGSPPLTGRTLNWILPPLSTRSRSVRLSGRRVQRSGSHQYGECLVVPCPLSFAKLSTFTTLSGDCHQFCATFGRSPASIDIACGGFLAYPERVSRRNQVWASIVQQPNT
jgi:hypothetical protein